MLFREPRTELHRLLGIHSLPFALPDNLFTQFLRFHFPDMCWAFALFGALILFTGLSPKASATVALILVSVTEGQQAAWRWSGFDWVDTGLMALALLLAYLIIPNEKKN